MSFCSETHGAKEAENAKRTKVFVVLLEVGVAGGRVEVVEGLVLATGLEFPVADGVALGAGAEGADAVGEKIGDRVGLDVVSVGG